MRPIDADKLKELWEPIAKMDCLTGSVVQSCINELDKQPTVKTVPTKSEFKRIAIQRGYVPVVRCRECKHGHPDIMSEEYTACRYRQTVMPNDGFCSYGERRNDERK